tara:strand:- start:192 stop:953 length:762 start_codon:yes stop_codon:yes gene_type:complete
MEGLKMHKVVDLEDKTKYPEINPILPQPPFLLLGIGSVRSGKTNALVNMLRRDYKKDGGMYGPEYFDDTLIISNTINNDPKGKYLKDAFRVEDHYEDRYINDLVESQKKHKRSEAPTVLLVLDDIISKDFKKTSSNSINTLATRFRHYEMSIMIFTQSFRAVSTMVRSNAQNVMIFRQQSSKELEKIAEEYADLCGDETTFLKYYNIAHSEPYQFLYIDGQLNPARFYKSFEELIGIGDQIMVEEPEPKKEPF